jgi:type VI secretion system protein ImpF
VLPSDALHPTLLDRLIDDAPGRPDDARHRRVLSPEEVRETVRRELAWLLETVRLDVTEDLDGHPHVASSVLNYGCPEICGRPLSSLDGPALAREVAKAIKVFEPRIIPSTLSVEIDAVDDASRPQALVFRIEAELRAEPVPLPLLLRSEIDVESGAIRVHEDRGTRGR